MNLGLASHQQRGRTEMRPGLKVLSERPEKRGTDLAILACYPLHHRRFSGLRKPLEAAVRLTSRAS